MTLQQHLDDCLNNGIRDLRAEIHPPHDGSIRVTLAPNQLWERLTVETRTFEIDGNQVVEIGDDCDCDDERRVPPPRASLISCLLMALLMTLPIGMSHLITRHQSTVSKPTVSTPKHETQSEYVLGSPSLIGSDWIDHDAEDVIESHRNGDSLVDARLFVSKTKPIDRTPTRQRSPQWDTVRARFIADGNDSCAVCGTTHDLNVHHVIPFHDDPTKELDPTNLITLCRVHHLLVGHDPDVEGPIKPSWKLSNPNVKADAERLRNKLKTEAITNAFHEDE